MSNYELGLFAGIIISLMGVAIQDFKFFAISWGWLPILAILAILEGLNVLPASILVQDYMMSFIFLFFQMLILTFWFSLRERRWVNISLSVLGLGDILFLFILIFFFSFANYVLFVIGASFMISIGYVLYQNIAKFPEKKIPFAGGLAALLVVVKVLSVAGVLINPFSNQYLWIG